MLLKDFPFGVIADDLGVDEPTQIEALRSELSHRCPVGGFALLMIRSRRLSRDHPSFALPIRNAKIYTSPAKPLNPMEVSLQAAKLTFTKAQNGLDQRQEEQVSLQQSTLDKSKLCRLDTGPLLLHS